MNTRVLWGIATGIILLLIVGLGGWYFFLQRQLGGIESITASRGLGEAAPSFGDAISNTFENVASDLGFTTGASQTDATDTSAPPRLFQLASTPTAGFGFNSTSTDALRFMERATGHIYEIDLTKNAPKRLTNTLIPQVYEAYFGEKGAVAGFAAKSPGIVDAFAGVVGGPTTTSEYFPFKNVSFGSDVRELAFAGDAILAVVENERGAVLVQTDLDGTDPDPLLSTGVADWRLTSLDDDRIILAQNPASGIAGYAYELSDGRLVPLARRVPGLTILPHPTNEGLLLIGSDSGSVSLLTERDGVRTSLPLRTIADKCVWAPPETATSSPDYEHDIAYCAVPSSIASTHFLDDWYKGLTHTSDSWWKVDATEGEAELLFSPESMGISLDAERPIVDDGGAYVIFRNATDKSLWALRIVE